MKNLPKIPKLIVAVGFALTISLGAHAAPTVVFQDSFENDGTGYNVPNTGSTPPYNQTHTGVVNTTPGDPSDGVANGGPDYITSAPTTMSGGYIAGQDGSDYVTLSNNGGAGTPDVSPYADRTPTAQTDTLTTVTGSQASGHPGTFLAGALYHLSVLIAEPSYTDSSLSATLSLYASNGTTSTFLKSETVDFGGGVNSPSDGNFHQYGFTFDTTTDPSIVGDSIQLAITAGQGASQIFGRGASFDDLSLSVPEPSSWALMLAGGAMLIGLSVRRVSRRA